MNHAPKTKVQMVNQLAKCGEEWGQKIHLMPLQAPGRVTARKKRIALTTCSSGKRMKKEKIKERGPLTMGTRARTHDTKTDITLGQSNAKLNL